MEKKNYRARFKSFDTLDKLIQYMRLSIEGECWAGHWVKDEFEAAAKKLVEYSKNRKKFWFATISVGLVSIEFCESLCAAEAKAKEDDMIEYVFHIQGGKKGESIFIRQIERDEITED